MATEEVKIFFKVDGLEGYITDLNDLENALGQVTDETKQATQATKNLEQANEMAAAETERRLDVLEGGVKLLAGSAEFAAGAFALLGEEGNEFFEATERNVIGVLALGRGLIDITEGYRLLKTNLDLAKTAQRAFNAVAKANPYVLLASALIAAAGAFLLFKVRAKEAQDQVDESRKAYELLNKTTQEKAQLDIDAVENLERLRDISEEVTEITNEELKTRTENLKAAEEAARLAIITAKDKLAAELAANKIIGVGFKSIGFVEKAQLALKEAQDAYNETQKTSNQELTIYNNELERRAKLEGEISNEENSGTLDRIEAKTLQGVETGRQAAELQIRRTELSETEKEAVVQNTQLQLEAEQSLFYAKQNLTQQGFALATALAGDNEKVAKIIFAGQKALEIAKIITQASGDIAGITSSTIKNASLATAQGFAGDLSGFVRAGAITAQGAAAAGAVKLNAGAAIAGIAASAISQFKNGGSVPGSVGGGGGGGGATLNYQVGGQEAGANVTGQFSGGAGGTGGVSQTYVLAGDVTSQQQAEAQIQNLARL